MAYQNVFNYESFNKDDDTITLQGDADIAPPKEGVLFLTEAVQEPFGDYVNVGRALYGKPITIWDETGGLISFMTSFTFTVESIPDFNLGDGIIFFLAPEETVAYISKNSSGGCLGIVDANSAFNQFVGVEFDTHTDNWDPKYGPHIGIDVNSVISLDTAQWIRTGEDKAKYKASITYNSRTKILTATLEYPDGSYIPPSTVSQGIDLKQVLPANVIVGLAAAQSTDRRAYHEIHSWSFSIQP